MVERCRRCYKRFAEKSWYTIAKPGPISVLRVPDKDISVTIEKIDWRVCLVCYEDLLCHRAKME